MNTETTITPDPQPLSNRTRNGKVARLPKALRDQISLMMLDGIPYFDIIQRLGPAAQHLTEDNLSNWKTGGYLDWLRQLQISEAIQAKHELAQSIVAKTGDSNAAGQAVLQAIAVNLCEFLAETDPATMRESLLSDADKFTRFVNAMVRLAEGGIKCEVHKFRAQDRDAESHKSTQPSGISDESLRIAEEKLNLL